jgi:hypothetical protein
LVHRFKVEILIPKYYNDNRRIEAFKHRITYQQIFSQFHGCTIDKAPLIGDWIDPKTGKRYRDRNLSCSVICDDNYDNMDFLNRFKTQLKERYIQEEIMMYSILINVI